MLLCYNNRYRVRERFESLTHKDEFTELSLLVSIKIENLPLNEIKSHKQSNLELEQDDNLGDYS